MRGLVTLGETMGIVRAAGFEQDATAALGIGGAESNVAIGVTRLGGAATWMGRVGDDPLGRRIVRELRAEGVTTRAAVDATAPTGLLLKSNPVAGRTSVVYYRAGNAGSRMAPTDLDLGAISDAGLLHVTGITPGLSSSAARAVDTALDAAGDVPVSFDINHRTGVWGGRDPRPTYRDLARHARIVFAGADEAALLVGTGTPEDLALRIADLGPVEVVIKLGSRGSVAVVDGALHEVAAIPVTPVDTVGAGDAFVAGYLTGWLEDAPAERRLDLARRCGAFACLGPGDWESAPRRSELTWLEHRDDPVDR